MKNIFRWAMYCLVISQTVVAQQAGSDDALLWKVNGKNLEKPSYIFGTYHFLTSGFIDTLPAIINAYKNADAVVGELVIDTNLVQPMMEASLLKETTLQQLLPDTLYNRASDWFRQEAGIDFLKLNNLNPLTIISLALAITRQKYFPNKPGEIQLDSYFQEEAKKDGKEIFGLETIEIQINAIYKQLAITRQAEILNDMFKNPGYIKDVIGVMNKAYISQDMTALRKLMYGSGYRMEEMKVLLDDRNNAWLQQLPQLMNKQSLFVAVGALHLVGNSGLINQLRTQGYTVTPVNLKQ